MQVRPGSLVLALSLATFAAACGGGSGRAWIGGKTSADFAEGSRKAGCEVEESYGVPNGYVIKCPDKVVYGVRPENGGALVSCKGVKQLVCEQKSQELFAGKQQVAAPKDDD